MEVGVESPAGVAMEFPANDGVDFSSPMMMPLRLLRRLSETKGSPLTVEEIETKLRHALLRRQKFYERLASKARPKPRSASRSSSNEELDIGQRLEAKLQAAEQKRLSMLAKSQLRLAKLDELRQAAKTAVEMRLKKRCAELDLKFESKVQKAEANRMIIFTANKQRRAKLKERTSQSLSRRIARENKYKERVRAAIFQKRLAAEKKRLGLLEEGKKRVHARVVQVRKVANFVSQQRETERRRMIENLEERLQKAKRQRAEYLMQRARVHNSLHANFIKMHEQGDLLSRRLARCWRKFVKLKKTTLDLTKSYNNININERSIKSMPFEQLAVLMESSSTLQTTKSLLDRLEIWFKASQSVNLAGTSCIDHLLKRIASPKRRSQLRKPARNGPTRPAREPTKSPVGLSRYQVRVVLCTYMILGHPDAVFSGKGEREIVLANSAEKFVKEFDFLVKIILEGAHDKACEGVLEEQWTFRRQIALFDSAWCAYLNSFVVWKVKDAECLEGDLVRAACQMELSMIQKFKASPDGESGNLTHDLKAIQKQVTEDQKLLREKVLHLSGDAGIVRMDSALSDTRIKYFEAKENGSPVGSPLNHSLSVNKTISIIQKPNKVVRTLFNDVHVPHQGFGSLNGQNLDMDLENELIVNEVLHEQGLISNQSFSGVSESHDIEAKVRETIENAFWDSITESMKQNEPKYDQIVELMGEIRDEIISISPESWKQEINEALDLDLLSQLLNSGKFDMDHFGKVLEYALVTIQKLSSSGSEEELKMAHFNLLKELAEIFQSRDRSNKSNITALIKGLRFVLEQIRALKQEISKARIRLMEPLLRGPAGLNYLKKAFTKRYGPPSDASSALPLTIRWLSSVCDVEDQEWLQHANSILELKNSDLRLFPSIALRTGGKFSFKINENQASTSANKTDKEFGEWKGEKVDLSVRLGLLKLVFGVSGLTREELPEALKLSFFRLRAVQAQVQKIIVISISILVLRQTLLSEKIVSSSDMEIVVSGCVKQLSELVDTNKDAGIREIVEILSQTAENRQTEADNIVKVESRKDVMGMMLKKSLQAGDPVFVRVSRAIYLAARGVLLGGSGPHGRELMMSALRQVVATALEDAVMEAAAVLAVVATVSGGVHGPWYQVLMENIVQG